MEKKMKEHILDDLKEYNDYANQLDGEKFTNDILKSFKDSKTYKHYVMLIPSDMNDYYSSVEHNTFHNRGYYQLMIKNRYGNRFFVPLDNVKCACDILEKENMVVESIQHKNIPVPIYLVTLNGRKDSKFDEDFEPPTDNN